MKLETLIRAGKFVGIALTGLVVVSCKKDNPKPEPKPEPVVTERTEAQLIKDDIYKYYKLYSLWADESIPDYLNNPSEFTDKYSSVYEVLTTLKKMTPVHFADGYDGVFDRFSRADGINGFSTLSTSAIKMDNADGYGISIQWLSFDNLTAVPYIAFVEGGSPGQEAGFKRSDLITAINGESISAVNIYGCGTTDGCQVIDADKNRFKKVFDAFDLNSLNLQVKRQDNSIYSQLINYTNYTIDPIYKDAIYEGQVGYLALSSFEEIKNNNINQQKMDAVFKKFEDSDIKSLVVDLRYNGGGYVDAAIYLAEKIGGVKADKKLMLKYETNKYLASKEATKLRSELGIEDTYFEAKSKLELNKIYFLVSDQTASAAEMLINVLVPHLNVEIISSSYRTYGKPVGFFETVIKNKVSYWPASFLLKNSRDNLGEKYNKGTDRNLRDYWDGLVPDKSNIEDDVTKEVGDIRETMLATALADALPSGKVKGSLRNSSIRTLKKVIQLDKMYKRPDRGMIKKR